MADPKITIQQNPINHSFLQDEEFNAAFEEWINMRKKIKKPLTDRAKRQALKKVISLSGGDLEVAIKIIDKSANKCWTDFYPYQENSLNGTSEKRPRGYHSTEEIIAAARQFADERKNTTDR